LCNFIYHPILCFQSSHTISAIFRNIKIKWDIQLHFTAIGFYCILQPNLHTGISDNIFRVIFFFAILYGHRFYNISLGKFSIGPSSS